MKMFKEIEVTAYSYYRLEFQDEEYLVIKNLGSNRVFISANGQTNDYVIDVFETYEIKNVCLSKLFPNGLYLIAEKNNSQFTVLATPDYSFVKIEVY